MRTAYDSELSDVGLIADKYSAFSTAGLNEQLYLHALATVRKSDAISRFVEAVAVRQKDLAETPENEFRSFTAPLSDIFKVALEDNPNISIDQGVMGGAPCITNTRIPVYAVLEILEECGTIREVQREYPRLSEDDIKAALRFSKTVVECPIDYEARSSGR